MIRVANIIEEGRLGGPHVRMSEVAKRLYQHSIYTVVILPSNESNEFLHKLRTDNVEHRSLILHRLTREKKHLIKYILFFNSELYRLYKIIKNENFDIVHVNNSSVHYKTILAGIFAGASIIMHLNETIMPSYVRLLFKLMSRFFASGYIVAGSRVRDYYLKHVKISELPVFEIQAPVDCKKFNPATVTKNVRMTKIRGKKIVTVANINFVKGLEYFITMAAQLNKYFNDLSFWIVGKELESQKKYHDKLLQQIKHYNITNIHFYGYCNDVRSILKATDIYVCSSIAEGSPMSLWEAMSMALPVVSTDVADVSKFIRNNRNGFVVPTKAPTHLADKCAILLKDRNKAKRFGARCRKIALKHLDIDICVQRHLRAYKEVFNARKS